MGDVFQGLFGGSSQKSQSGNNAYPYITSTFSPTANLETGTTGEMAGLLGLGGGDPQAFQKYLNSTGYNFQLDSGSRAITNNAAARGLLDSGSTLKALTKYGQQVGSSAYGNYLGQLSDLAKTSLGAGSLIGNAGQYSKGSGSSDTGNAGKDLFALMALACDRRLKTNVERVGTLPDGLPIYAFDYVEGHGLPEGRRVGPMADEVADYQPWALGPVVDGYATIIPAFINMAPDPNQVARFL